MLPALTFEEILDRADIFGQPRPLSDRLVSIVFANPTSPIWEDLHGNRSFLDLRSGESWDLFFAGLSGFAPDRRGGQATRIHTISGRRSDFVGYFNPACFNDIAGAVELGHRQALQASGGPAEPWRYLGGTSVVSFMTYGREPDWLSLRDVPLYTPGGNRFTLINVVEGLARWQKEIIDPRLAPGEVMHGVSSHSALLAAALGWTASAVVGGVLGNSAYELLKQLLE